MILILLVFILSFTALHNGNELRDETELDKLVTVKTFGYKNIKNSGPFDECCGAKTDDNCEACRYEFALYKKYEDFFALQDWPIGSVGVFSVNATEIFQTFIYKKVIESCEKVTIFLAIKNVDCNDQYIDNTHKIPTTASFLYEYVESLGMQQRVYFFAEISVKNVDKNERFVFMFFALKKLRFLDYKVTDDHCCNEEDENHCVTPCDFEIMMSPFFGRTTTIQLQAFFENSSITTMLYWIKHVTRVEKIKSVMLYVVDSNSKSIFDIFKGEKLTKMENVRYSKEDSLGLYNQTRLSVSYGFRCQGYYANSCAILCNAVRHIEYCDDSIMSVKCYNLAKDRLFCEANATTECRNDLCLNGGTCRVRALLNNEPVCRCKRGYYGKYCQSFFCENECNGNGRCIGPNECKCHYPYAGATCGHLLLTNQLQNNLPFKATCYLVNQTLQCECQSLVSKNEKYLLVLKLLNGKIPVYYKRKKASFDCNFIPFLVYFKEFLNRENLHQKVKAFKFQLLLSVILVIIAAYTFFLFCGFVAIYTAKYFSSRQPISII